MQHALGWEPIMDQGHIIGLVEPTRRSAISLEPGEKIRTVRRAAGDHPQTCREGNAHLAQLHEIASYRSAFRFLGLGGGRNGGRWPSA